MATNIFISWSSVDQRIKPIAVRYKNWLKSIFEDKIEVFFSEEIEPAQKPMEHIHENLEKADIGLVFVTQRTARSPWVIYEFGCMHKLHERESLYTILLDLNVDKLGNIAPPLAQPQAILLNKKDNNIKLIESIAKKIPDSDFLEVKSKAQDEYNYIEDCIITTQNNFANLPDKYEGEIPYNNNIMGSNNFQMPEIFNYYNKNIFLVGINLGMLFNIASDSRSMDCLIDSLINDKEKTAKILISNLWDEKIFYTFNKMIFGYGADVHKYMSEIFFDKESKFYLDNYIRSRCTDDEYISLKKQLTIKRIDLLLDTFWFVDTSDKINQGNMLLAPFTARTGAERPVFYASKQKNATLYNKYFEVCKSGFDYSNNVLWPLNN